MLVWLQKCTTKNAPLAFRLAGRFCVRKRGRVAYCTELTPRRTFGHPTPLQRPVSSILTASTIINQVGPTALARYRPPIINPGIVPRSDNQLEYTPWRASFLVSLTGHP